MCVLYVLLYLSYFVDELDVLFLDVCVHEHLVVLSVAGREMKHIQDIVTASGKGQQDFQCPLQYLILPQPRME
jgi:hypothetical protein